MSARGASRTPIQVVLVSKIHLFREGLAQLLAKDDRLEVLDSFEGADQAIAAIAELDADCVLLDMVSREAGEMARAIRAAWPDSKIVALGISEADIVDSAENGISGFVLRDGSVEELVRSVQAAMAEELVCSQKMAAALLRRIGRLAARLPTNEEVRLTPREAQIVDLIDRGMTNKEIAARLVVEVSTVKNHVHNVLEKLGVRTRGEAAARVRAWRSRRRALDEAHSTGPHRRF